jgi:hypothetical protein
MNDRRVLTPDPYSSEWRVFLDEMWQHTGCHGDHRVASLLLELGGYEVEASLALYRDQGGWCDCEIRLNLDAPTLEEELELFAPSNEGDG